MAREEERGEVVRRMRQWIKPRIAGPDYWQSAMWFVGYTGGGTWRSVSLARQVHFEIFALLDCLHQAAIESWIRDGRREHEPNFP